MSMRCAIVLSVCGCSATSIAGVMDLTYDGRSQVYTVSTEDLSGHINDSTTDVEPKTAFSEWDFQASSSIPNWQVEGSHYSTVSESLLQAEGSVSGSVGPDTAGYSLNWALASNSYQIRFEIQDTTTFNLTAMLEASLGPSSAEIEIRKQRTNAVVWSARTTSGVLNIDEQITLIAAARPQIYIFTIQSNVGLGYIEGDYSASYSGSFRPVPAPSAIGVLGASGLIASRRRR